MSILFTIFDEVLGKFCVESKVKMLKHCEHVMLHQSVMLTVEAFSDAHLVGKSHVSRNLYDP